MENSTTSDSALLAEWLGEHREAAFQTLVARYGGLVHATARRTCSDDSMAGEVFQLTFITLAQKAKSLTSCASLGGWLHTTALMQAKNLLRKSQRENRKRQLLQTAMEIETPHAANEIWKEMQPVLDDALASLSETDREALLLRFYRSLTIREIAAILGIATDATQKRIDRATGRLHGKLARRGCHAGGLLAAAMLAGFATDSQAAVPLLSS
ncbi:MAG: sigma-70 family RNA polymerase sigma factor [Verrucomicrobiota bacterium]